MVLNGRRREILTDAAARLAAQGIGAEIAAFDVTDAAAVAEGVARIARDVGAVDILVNNAAINQRKPFGEFSPDEWRSLHAANLDGPFLVTRAVLASMQSRRRGKVINICSLASDLGRPNIVPYAASKGALKMLTARSRSRSAPHNVQVNGIAPVSSARRSNAALTGDAEFSAWVSRRTPAAAGASPRRWPARRSSSHRLRPIT